MNPLVMTSIPAILAAIGSALLCSSLGGAGSIGGLVAASGLLLGAGLLQAYNILRAMSAVRALSAWSQGDDVAAPPPDVPRPFMDLGDLFHDKLKRVGGKPTSTSPETRRVRVEARALRRQHDALLQLLESLSDGVILIDPEGSPRIVNRAARDLLELRGEIDPDQIPAGVVNPALRTAITEAVQGKKGGRAARDIDASDPTRRLVLRMFCQDVRGKDDTNEPASLAIVLRDVTRDRELNQMKSDFASSVSHELKTPLSSMRAFLEMMIDGDIEGEEAQKEHLQLVLDESERLTRLIQNLLNLSRLESGVTRMDRDSVPMIELINHIGQLATPLARARGQEISFEVSEYLPAVTGDRNLLEQGIMNLVSNAIKYTPEGGTVRVRAGLLGSEIEFAVIDSGVGIPEKALGLIFEKFTRIENSAGLKATGTGLGLPLAKFVTEAHGGRITVTSEVGKGSDFRMYLPARRGTESGEARLVGLEGMSG